MTYVKLALGVALLIALCALGEHFYSQAYTAGAQSVQVKWDKSLIDYNHVLEANEIANKKKLDDVLANNEVIRASYEDQLTTAQSNAADFATRLRNAYLHGSAVPKAGNQPGATPASAPASDDRLTGLLERAAAETLANDAQLDALVKQLQPQL